MQTFFFLITFLPFQCSLESNSKKKTLIRHVEHLEEIFENKLLPSWKKIGMQKPQKT
jgi:hypothetical protein